MREIKFRAWHKELKQMFSAEEMWQDQLTLMPDGRGFANISGTSTELSQIDNGRRMIPLQFTGLKDKNGKEIYEGDMLAYADGRLTKVIWHEYCLMWDAEGLNTKGVAHAIADSYSLEPEVIGNIYENPELLEDHR